MKCLTYGVMAVIEKLRNSVPKESLYFFPIIDFRGNPTPEQRADWEAKFRAGPTGLLLYHPTGGTRQESPPILFF
jgi:hypothetical protein